MMIGKLLAYHREYHFENMPDVIGDWQALDGLSDEFNQYRKNYLLNKH